jgi:hypothetical protein
MPRPVARWAATSRAMIAEENAGWSHSATSAPSSERENWRSVARPARREEAMPSAQAGFSAINTGRRASAGRILSACAPSTTTTGHAGDANAASTARTTSGWPSTGSNCFGEPIRVEAPAAKMTQPNRIWSAEAFIANPGYGRRA